MTIGKQFREDPRIAKAKELLRDALAEHQQKITGPRNADSTLAEEYNRLVEQAGELRGRPLYFPYLGSGIGKGPLVELADGSMKYDFICGIGVHVLGHSHPDLIEACINGSLSDTVMQGHLQQNPESVELSDSLLKLANRKGGHLAHCFLSTSGAMANENALKIIFQKKSPAHRILAFEKCFMGRTLVLAQVTDKPAYRVGLPENIPIDYIPFFDAERPEESTDIAVQALKAKLAEHPGEYALMAFELIQGERGAFPGNTSFFQALFRVLREHDVAILIDEVQTFGRTSEPFAFQHFKLDEYADVVTVGKLLQVCATLFSKEYNPKPGLLSQTFTGSTTSLFASIAVLRHLTEGSYFGPGGRIEQLHNCFATHLQTLGDKHDGIIQGPFGVGAMVGFTAFDGSFEMAQKVVMSLYHAGVLSFMAGRDPTRVRFLLPYANMDEGDIEAVAALIEETLLAVAKQAEQTPP